MTGTFPRADLAAHLGHRRPALRALALLAALRLVGEAELVRCDVAASELEALVAEGLALRFRLQRRLTDLEPTFVYALAKHGAVELAVALGVDVDGIPFMTKARASRAPLHVDHEIAVSRFALALARAFTTDPRPLSLASWEQDGAALRDAVVLAERGREGRLPLEADGLATVLAPGRPEGLLVEVDRGTEKPVYLARKMAGWAEWHRARSYRARFSLPALRILYVAPNEKRSRQLRQICREASLGTGGAFWIASEEDILKLGALAPIWDTMHRDRLPLWNG